MRKKTSLKILYTSDLHGHALPMDYGTNEYAELGLAKIATAVKNKRQELDQVLMIDNGDLIQGTPFMTHYIKEHTHKPNPMIAIMNGIGIDAAVLGNHEFNYGKKVLQQAVDESNFPWLSANILDEKTGKPYYGPPYLIQSLPSGLRVAVVGVTTHYIPNWESSEHIQGIRFADAYESLTYWVEKIRKEEQIDLLVGVYHGGFERDIETGEAEESLTGENQGYEMAENISGMDVLLTGHQHRQLTGRIGDCLVIQPGKNGEAYGEIDIEFEMFENDWIITNKQAKIESVNGIEADPVIVKQCKPLEQSVQNWLDKPIGTIEGDMMVHDPFQAKIQKHAFVELVQNVQLDATGADISVTALFDNKPGGFPSTVTMRDIVTNYKYPNTLTVLELTGKDIKQALEKSAMYFTIDEQGNLAVNKDFLEPKPQHYNYDMWEGVDYTIRVSNPEGSRVENIFYKGEPLHPTRTYRVVMNNYRASGGGNFKMFQGKPVVKELKQDMVELISNYIQKHETIQAVVTENFVVKR